MTFAGRYEADLADLTSGAFKGRSSETQRAMFNFSGHPLADLAAAQVVYDTARKEAWARSWRVESSICFASRAPADMPNGTIR